MSTEKRRAPGEGSIYQRADGRWEAVLDLGFDATGKRRRRKAVASTKREAGARLAMLARAASSGLEPDAARWTIADWLTRWLQTEARPALRPRTFAVYEIAARLHLIPALGRHPLQKLTATHVREYIASRTAEGAAPQTIKNEHAVLRRALEVGTRYSYLERNVARLVAAPVVHRDEVDPLNAAEIRQFLVSVRGHPFEALFVLAASTGMRHAEVTGLTWECVDLEAGTLRVEQTLARYSRAFHMDPPKTRQSRRTIALAAETVRALRAHRLRQLEDKLRSAAWLNDWNLVFTGANGEPIEARRLLDEFVKALKRADVRRVRFHDLRHGAATYLLAEGVAMKVVQEVLGHSQIGMTADLYSHVVPELRRDAANRMGSVLFAGN